MGDLDVHSWMNLSLPVSEQYSPHKAGWLCHRRRHFLLIQEKEGWRRPVRGMRSYDFDLEACGGQRVSLREVVPNLENIGGGVVGSFEIQPKAADSPGLSFLRATWGGRVSQGACGAWTAQHPHLPCVQVLPTCAQCHMAVQWADGHQRCGWEHLPA